MLMITVRFGNATYSHILIPQDIIDLAVFVMSIITASLTMMAPSILLELRKKHPNTIVTGRIKIWIIT